MGFERTLTCGNQQITIQDKLLKKAVYYNGELAAEFSGTMDMNAEFTVSEGGETVHYHVNLKYKMDIARWFGARNTCTVRRNGLVVDMMEFK